MSRASHQLRELRRRVPRASGDEPEATQEAVKNLACSPRERG